MKTALRLGYFAHWFQPAYRLPDFFRDLGVEIEQINYHEKNYLEKYDVAIIEQNGFDDYIENDELYIREWVQRGGILLFLHQDYARWAPYFLPEDLGYTQLIHRHLDTVRTYRNYMMPWIEEAGLGLFNTPNRITGDELLDWHVPVNSFGINTPPAKTSPETLCTAAQSCYLLNPAWEVLGSYMDPAVRDGVLLARGRYGRGLVFLNQLLMPEVKPEAADRCFSFWRKYLPNLLAAFARFRAGEPEPVISRPAAELPAKKYYKMAIHMHSLDWYGCDAAPGTINALMRYRHFDICALSVKDTGPYAGKLNPARFSDDHCLFLDGQEYHPFNWGDAEDAIGHNNYHLLAIGIDPDAYTPEFTRSLYGDAEVDAHLKRALTYVREHHGVSCATHPWSGYWRKYPFDAVDYEGMRTICGTPIDEHWLAGNKITLMNSVDLFGTGEFYANPALNMLYLQGEKPGRDSVVRAVKAGHCIAACFFDEADVTLGPYLPGDTLSAAEAAELELRVSAAIFTGNIRQLRVYSGAELIWQSAENSPSVDRQISLRGLPLKTFVRVEVEGEQPKHIVCSTPFYLAAEK